MRKIFTQALFTSGRQFIGKSLFGYSKVFTPQKAIMSGSMLLVGSFLVKIFLPIII